MRPRPRMRKTIKWGGAAVCVLLAVAWMGSRWWSLTWEPSTKFKAMAAAGRLYVYVYLSAPDTPVPLWEFIRRPEYQSWRFDGQIFAAGGGHLYIPLWAPLLAVLIVTMAAWWLDRRTRHWALIGACTKCGYNRAGLAADAVCPECGATP